MTIQILLYKNTQQNSLQKKFSTITLQVKLQLHEFLWLQVAQSLHTVYSQHNKPAYTGIHLHSYINHYMNIAKQTLNVTIIPNIPQSRVKSINTYILPSKLQLVAYLERAFLISPICRYYSYYSRQQASYLDS